MSMKQYLESVLAKLGSTNLEWNSGRLGYCVLADRYGIRTTVNIGDLVDECIFLEEKFGAYARE